MDHSVVCKYIMYIYSIEYTLNCQNAIYIYMLLSSYIIYIDICVSVICLYLCIMYAAVVWRILLVSKRVNFDSQSVFESYCVIAVYQ